MAYRVSFMIWRMRSVLQLLTLYYLWFSITTKSTTFFHYSQSQLLTYVFGSSIAVAVIFSTRTTEVANDINEGSLSNFLIRPMSYFTYVFARDIGDKLFNCLCSLFELILLVLLLKPNLFLQTNYLSILGTIFAIGLGVINYFLIGFLIGAIGFWSSETWGPRFIFGQILGFLSGGLFPLDILPKPLFTFVQLLPFPYLQYFPLKIYLGQITGLQTIVGFFISALWTVFLSLLLRAVWSKGVKQYGAYGR